MDAAERAAGKIWDAIGIGDECLYDAGVADTDFSDIIRAEYADVEKRMRRMYETKELYRKQRDELLALVLDGLCNFQDGTIRCGQCAKCKRTEVAIANAEKTDDD